MNQEKQNRHFHFQIPPWYIILLLLLLFLFPSRALDSEAGSTASILQLPLNDLEVNLLYIDHAVQHAYLLGADADNYLLYDPVECSQALVGRDKVLSLDLNLGIDLRQLHITGDHSTMRDQILLKDGSRIQCVVLDISKRLISYAQLERLNRSLIELQNVRELRLADDQLLIPFTTTTL